MHHILAVHPGPIQRAAKFGYHGTFVEEDHRPGTAGSGASRGHPAATGEAGRRFSFRYTSDIWPEPFSVREGGGSSRDQQTCTWLTLMTIEREPPDEKRREMDLDLVRQSLRGDEGAIGCLVTRLSCVPRILSVMNQKMGAHLSDHDLADLSQDILIVVWGKLDSFEGRGKLESWVYRFCFLEYMNRIRRRERRTRLVPSRLETLSEVAAPAVASSLEYEQLEVGLSELGPPEAEVIRLKHFDELTFNDIGSRLKMSPNSAKTCYYRGLAWLRRRLECPAAEEKP